MKKKKLGKGGTQQLKEPPKISKKCPHNILVKLPGVVEQNAKDQRPKLKANVGICFLTTLF